MNLVDIFSKSKVFGLSFAKFIISSIVFVWCFSSVVIFVKVIWFTWVVVVIHNIPNLCIEILLQNHSCSGNSKCSIRATVSFWMGIFQRVCMSWSSFLYYHRQILVASAWLALEVLGLRYWVVSPLVELCRGPLERVLFVEIFVWDFSFQRILPNVGEELHCLKYTFEFDVYKGIEIITYLPKNNDQYSKKEETNKDCQTNVERHVFWINGLGLHVVKYFELKLNSSGVRITQSRELYVTKGWLKSLSEDRELLLTGPLWVVCNWLCRRRSTCLTGF